MSVERNLHTILDGYDKTRLSLGTIGTHSAIDVTQGAKQEGIPNFVVAEEGRHITYTKGLKERQQGQRTIGCVQEVKVVEKWKDMLQEDVVEWMRAQNGVFVPNRSLAMYLRDPKVGYDSILALNVPYFGNIDLLQAEERETPFKVEYNQDFLSVHAQLPVPDRYEKPEDIRGPALIKASRYGQERNFERYFVLVNSADEYYDKLNEVLKETPPEYYKQIKDAFESAPIQQFLGQRQVVNLNFFYSPIWEDLEFMGSDTRAQFPPKSGQITGEEATHHNISLRESSHNQVFEMGYALVDAVKKYYPMGLVGAFAIQCIGDENELYRPIDLSLRIPGSPDVGLTPNSQALYGKKMSCGRRIARELKDAVQKGALPLVLS